MFEQYTAELEAAGASTVDQKTALEEFLERAQASLQESNPLGQAWFRGLAHRLTRAVSYKDEPTLLSAEAGLRNLYATARLANDGEQFELPAATAMTEAFVLAGLEIAVAGVAAIGTDVGADYVQASDLRKDFLSVVAGTPDISGRILASRLGKGEKPLDEGQLSRLAKGLHDRGLVDRRKVGQRVLYRLTPRGGRVVALLQLAPEIPFETELVVGEAESLTKLLKHIDLENVEKPIHLTMGSAALTAVPQQEGRVELFIEDATLDTESLAVVLRQPEIVVFGGFVDGLAHFEQIEPGIYTGSVETVHEVAGTTLVDIGAQPTSSSSVDEMFEDLRSQDGALRVALRVRPDQALEAHLESSTPRWGEDAAVLRWNPEDGEEKTLVAALSDAGDGTWRASVVLEDVAEPGQLQVPLEPVTWRVLSEDSEFADVVSVSLSAATDYAETLTGWRNASPQLPEPIRSEVTSVLNEYG